MSKRPLASGTIVPRTELTPEDIIKEIEALMFILNTNFFKSEKEAQQYGKINTTKYSVRIEVRERQTQ